MKNVSARFFTDYLTGLRTHLEGNPYGKTGGAKTLGLVALDRKISAPDMAVLHDKAMSILVRSRDFSPDKTVFLHHAHEFLAQALAPLEKDRLAAQKTNARLLRHNETLRLNAAELAAANRLLAREVARRKTAEAVTRRAQDKYRALFLESAEMQKKLRRLTRQTLSSQEADRKKISRELHDDIGQLLAGINVELETLGQSAPADLRPLQARITRTQRLVTRSIDEIHRFARELRPAVLDDLGLIAALHSYSKTLSLREHIKVRITAFRGVETLDNTRQTVLFRVAQEALKNVVRHADATLIAVVIAQVGKAVRMEITDNGKSFVVHKVHLSPNPNRLGLVGMRERLGMVGGTLAVTSAPGQGTTVCAEIPYSSAKLAS